MASKPSRAGFVSSPMLVEGVLSAIDFDDQFGSVRNKVDDVRADGSLAAEAQIIQTASADYGPQLLLSVGHWPAETLGRFPLPLRDIFMGHDASPCGEVGG